MILFITDLQFQNLFVQFYGFYVFDQRAVVENSVSGKQVKRVFQGKKEPRA